MIISEQAARQACWREHEAILRCCAEWDRQGRCTPALEAGLAHHSVVLQILRDFLERECHAGNPPESGFDSRISTPKPPIDGLLYRRQGLHKSGHPPREKCFWPIIYTSNGITSKKLEEGERLSWRQ